MKTEARSKRCGAKTRAGGQCRRWVLRGQERCRLHAGRPITHGAYSKFLREKCKGLSPYVDLVEAADAEAGGVTLAGETLAMRARLAQELAEDAPPLDLATLATAARGLVATDKALEQLVPAYVAMEHLRETLRVVRSNTDTETFEAITVELVRRGLVSRAPDL